ncbi:type I restriction enzyme endonuclease domain-containing protein [Streptomyces kaempferi]
MALSLAASQQPGGFLGRHAAQKRAAHRASSSPTGSREPARARLRSAIKRLLARRSYPPDQEVDAIKLVLKQMEHFANEWSTKEAKED